MTVLAKNLRKTLYAREAGSNKQLASRACCLSLVRQLFHAGELEAYTGERRKKKHSEVSLRKAVFYLLLYTMMNSYPRYLFL